jgi:hypothetical protein
MKSRLIIVFFISFIYTSSAFAQSNFLRQLETLDFLFPSRHNNQDTSVAKSQPRRYVFYQARTRQSLSIQPLSVIGSGLDFSYDYFSKNKFDVKMLGGFYTSSGRLGYYENQPTSVLEEGTIYKLQGSISDMQGYKVEMHLKRFIYRSDSSNYRYSLGVFAQYRQIAGKFSGEKRTPDSSYYEEITQRRISATALIAGPVMSITYQTNKSLFLQCSIGCGFVFPLNGSEESRELFHIASLNPYTKSLGLKFNFAIGFYLD